MYRKVFFSASRCQRRSAELIATQASGKQAQRRLMYRECMIQPPPFNKAVSHALPDGRLRFASSLRPPRRLLVGSPTPPPMVTPFPLSPRCLVQRPLLMLPYPVSPASCCHRVSPAWFLVAVVMSFLFLSFEMCASSLMKFVEVFLCSFRVQWAWYRFSGACIRIVFAKLPAFVAIFPRVRRVWSFLGLICIWYWVGRS